jgi:four helix bundle protein
MITGNRKLRVNSKTQNAESADRLENYGIYQLARELFHAFWDDSEIMLKDVRGRELVKQQVRSLDSICANIEEGYGRGFGKELPQHLKIARGEARESRGRFERSSRSLPPDTIAQRVATLDHIIGGLTKTIRTIESRNHDKRLPSPVTRNPSRQ